MERSDAFFSAPGSPTAEADMNPRLNVREMLLLVAGGELEN